MLNYEFPPLGGGAANANYYLLKEFAKDATLEIDLITSSPDIYKEEQFSKNIKIYKLDVKKQATHYWTSTELLSWYRQAKKLARKLASENKYDLCHCWFGWPSGLIGYHLRHQIPYIVALRGSDVPGYNNRLRYLDPVFFRPLSRRVWKHAAAVTVNSAGLKQLAQQTLQRDMPIIYNGVDTTQFQPKSKKYSKKLRLVSTGRLIERKGYHYLIDALADVPDVSLTLIGGGNMRPSLEAQAKAQKVTVRFLGEQDKKKLILELQQADVIVLPSLNEGMSNSLLEAMACGLPVIVTDVGGSKELISDNGVYVQKASASDLRKAIIHYRDNPKIRLQQAKNSRKQAQKMSWKEAAIKYSALYQQLLI